jgi:hypothetical protein
MPGQLPDTVDRHNLVAALRTMIAAAEAVPQARLHRRVASPAGIPLELWFDDEADADLYAARLADDVEPRTLSSRIPLARLYVLGAAALRTDVLPAWTDSGCDPVEFQSIVTRAGWRAAYPLRPRQWLAFDTAASVGVQLAHSTADLPDWFAGAPLRQHLHWLVRARGDRIAHAGTLGLDRRGILLLGHGGSGKSGTTLAGIAAGLQTVGDDYVALSGVPPVARALFRIAKQDKAGLARIAGLGPQLSHRPLNWMNKVEFDPAAIFPGCFTNALRMAAIVLPTIAHARVPGFTSAAAGEAMRILIPTNLYSFAGEPIDGMDYFADLMRSMPVYRLALSDDAAANGAVLAEFVAALN